MIPTTQAKESNICLPDSLKSKSSCLPVIDVNFLKISSSFQDRLIETCRFSTFTFACLIGRVWVGAH